MGSQIFPLTSQIECENLTPYQKNKNENFKGSYITSDS